MSSRWPRLLRSNSEHRAHLTRREAIRAGGRSRPAPAALDDRRWWDGNYGRTEPVMTGPSKDESCAADGWAARHMYWLRHPSGGRSRPAPAALDDRRWWDGNYSRTGPVMAGPTIAITLRVADPSDRVARRLIAPAVALAAEARG